MEAFAAGAGVVGDFVALVPRCFQAVEGQLKKIGIPLLALRVFTGLEPAEKRRVFLVGQAVGREVFGGECDGFFQRRLPLGERLGGNGKHEVEVHVVEARLAQDFIRTLGLLRAVDAPEDGQQRRVPRLHAHADPVDAQRAEQARFFQRNRRRVHLQRPFRERAQVQSLAHPREQVIQLRRGKRARGAAAEENRLRLQGVARGFPVEFRQQGVQKPLRLILIRCFLIEGAVRADFQAERDVDVKMAGWRHRESLTQRRQDAKKRFALLAWAERDVVAAKAVLATAPEIGE